ncbi:MAG TPA: tetratricopeptide repeat protein, partial [Clostridia bacterium]|nr:tetratricopeptide repeat protein [Clostridia bacterium]
MTKIKFKINEDTLEPLIERYIENGEPFKALSLLRRAPYNINSMLNIAEILGDMDFISQSDDVLYQVKKLDIDNEDANLLLAQNAFARGDIASAVYYANDEAFEMMNEMYQNDQLLIEPRVHEKYRIVYPKDEKYVDSAKDAAGEEFTKGNFAKAYAMYQELLTISPNDMDLLNDTGFVCIMLNKPEQARKYVEKALEIDGNSAAALSNAVLLYDMLEMIDMRDTYSERLDNVVTDDLVKIFKTAAAFCECGDHTRAEKWLEKYLDARYNLEIMLLYAIACYNAKNYLKAKETLLRLLSVEPENETVSYYLDYIKTHRDEKYHELEYTPQLPTEIIEEKIENLQSMTDFHAMWDDKKLFSQIDWAVNNVNGDAFVTETVDKIADTNKKKAREYLAKMLLKPKFSLKSKKYILKKVLELGAEGKISIVSEHKFYQIALKSFPKSLVESMREVVSTLAFEKILSKEDISKLYSV